jgi:hypothetical protein
MPEPRWLRFLDVGLLGRRTRAWTVVTKDSGEALGLVDWYGAWRCYVFTPTLEVETVYEQRCLRDIADFVEARTKEHKAARAATKEVPDAPPV